MRHPGKTPPIQESFDAGLERSRGLLKWPPPAGLTRHVRRKPSADLAPWIDCFWLVTWDLDQPYLQETLPHPNFYFAFQDRRSTVGGVHTGKSSHLLQGRSGVFGIKFRPGAFRPFIGGAAVLLANRIVPAADIFGEDIVDLETSLDALSWAEEPMIADSSAFLRKHLSQPDPAVEQADRLVTQIREDSEIRTVSDLASKTGVGMRALQRIFREYVGASPKWVIRRFRLHELVEVLNAGEPADWCQVALELGYFDQAHLINDFKAIAGGPPNQYSSVGSGGRLASTSIKGLSD